MGIVFLHGNGGSGGGSGGGSELTIVGGTTRPATATQNTIWVNTDTEITDYTLSGAEPTSPVEGMVWITIGASGSIKMASPVGGDWITVYPLSAKQYISGAWVGKAAESYQNGEWVEWIRYLYNKGDECTDITGGWRFDFTPGSQYWSKGTGTKNANSITLSGSNRQELAAVTTKKVDVTNISTLFVEVDNFTFSGSGTNYNGVLGITNNADGGSTVSQKTFKVNGTHTLDVSEFTGVYYVCVRLIADANCTVKIEFSEVRAA